MEFEAGKLEAIVDLRNVYRGDLQPDGTRRRQLGPRRLTDALRRAEQAEEAGVIRFRCFPHVPSTLNVD